MAATLAARHRKEPTLKSVLKWVGVATAGLSLVMGISQAKGLFGAWRARTNTVSHLVTTSRLERSAREYASAWRDAQQALDLQPRCRECKEEQLQVALEWLRNIRLSGDRGEESFSEVTDKTLPVIYRAAAEANGSRGADLSAHIGWANFLRWRDGRRGLEIDGNFREALKRDPANFYAHAMLGLWVLYPGGGNGNLAVATDHFAAALRSAKSTEDRRFVRDFQLAALLNRHNEFGPQIIRIVDEMRRNDESLDLRQRARIAYSAYYEGFEQLWPQMSSILPSDEHTATFLWLTDAKQREQNTAYRIIFARLMSESGDRSQAIRLYKGILADSPFLLPTMRSAIEHEVERSSGIPKHSRPDAQRSRDE
jgi:hypothetical protein